MVAQRAIRASGGACYRVGHDTFHHHIGPDEETIVGSTYDVAMTGLVHVSGVEAEIPAHDYRDEHRVLPGAADRLKSREQILRLDALGYTGDYSFEPFARDVQQLARPDLVSALTRSLAHLRG